MEKPEIIIISVTFDMPVEILDMLNDLRIMTAERLETEDEALVRIISRTYHEQYSH